MENTEMREKIARMQTQRIERRTETGRLIVLFLDEEGR